MFDTQITVNGNRCKQFNHNGRTFVQANHGSEYEIEIKNNYYKRILAVCSVDGLDVLTGKPANGDAGGYIIDAYHPIKIKGFRYDDDSVGAFRFSCKGGSYAASKQDGSERNCGVIGIRLYYEVEPIVVVQPQPYIVQPFNPWIIQPAPWTPTWTTSGGTEWVRTGSYPCNPLGGLYGAARFGYQDDVQYSAGGSGMSVGTTLSSAQPMMDYGDTVRSREPRMEKLCASPTPKGFDMGTAWGQKKDSKVFTTDFNRGCLALSQDIYYASRESLIEMGVPITNELKVNLPQSFPGKYAEPPSGWRG
jgi:hypothetical protein